jgi:uncharacterized protein (UPF0147 family)
MPSRSRFGYPIVTALTLACGIAVCGCRDTNDSPVVARVGNVVLTLSKLYESVPPEYGGQISRDQHIGYVKQWIDAELLYQDALRRHIDREKPIVERLSKMKRDLLVGEVISRSSDVGRAVQIPEEAIQDYYDRNQASFVRATDVVKYLEIVVDDPKTAQQVRAAATPQNFPSLGAQYSKFPVASGDSATFVAPNALPAEVSSALASTKVNTISSPVRGQNGYSIFCVLDKQSQGTQCDIQEVRDDIISQLTSRAHKSEVERLLLELRRSMEVSFDFEAIPAQSGETPGAGHDPFAGK